MSRERQLRIGLSLAATWVSSGAWRRSDSRVEEVHTAGFYTDVAAKAEAAALDFLFRPDSLFLDPAGLEAGPGFSSLDPTLMLTAAAACTRSIGLVTTVSTSFYPPFIAARQLQSLNWLSGGRAGWNIVTSLDGAANFGGEQMPPAEARYEQAREFTSLVEALWRSYPAQALLYDRESGRFADPDKVRPVEHRGEHFAVRGPLNLPAYPHGRLPFFQAGASPSGRDFAARIADGVFASSPDMAAAAELRGDLRARAAGHGRSPEAVRLLPGLSLFLASSRAEARDLYAATHQNQNMARKRALILDSLGLDIETLSPDQPITPELLPRRNTPPRSRTHADLLVRLVQRERPRLRDLLARPEVAGSGHWLVIGCAEDAVAEIVRWFEADAMDGFIALPGGSAGSLDLFLSEVVPALQELGLFQDRYEGETFAARFSVDRPG